MSISAFIKDLDEEELEEPLRSHAAALTELAISSGSRSDLAAYFDAIVAAQYYRFQKLLWTSCPVDGRLYAPFTNACPGCLARGDFKHVRGQKPPSAVIGRTNAKSLQAILFAWATRSSPNVRLLTPKEPVDFVMVDEESRVAFAAEIKAAPLLTLPLVAESAYGISSNDHVAAMVDIAPDDIHILLPTNDHVLEIPCNEDFWGLVELLGTNSAFAQAYLTSWHHALDSYTSSSTAHPVRWFSNSCGEPRPRPPDWPRRQRGTTGYEVISDRKNSVGMDRTDDIKKAVAQLLDVNVSFWREGDRYRLTTGIVSNLHSIRHHVDYVAPLLEVVWGFSADPVEPAAGSRSAPFKRLIDGIVTLDRIFTSDPWIRNTFSR